MTIKPVISGKQDSKILEKVRLDYIRRQRVFYRQNKEDRQNRTANKIPTRKNSGAKIDYQAELFRKRAVETQIDEFRIKNEIGKHHKILFAVSRKYSLTIDQIKKGPRTPLIVQARWEIYFRCRHELQMTYQAISEEFRNADDTSVVNNGITRMSKVIRSVQNNEIKIGDKIPHLKINWELFFMPDYEFDDSKKKRRNWT